MPRKQAYQEGAAGDVRAVQAGVRAPPLVRGSHGVTSRTMRFAAVVLGALFLPWLAWPLEASAYRPFDGTDADVAALHETELELQTVGYYRAGSSRYFDPGGVVNYGLFPRVELVLQGFDFVPQGTASGLNRLTDTGLFVKAVWREGCLQQKEGPSFAT